MTSLLSTPENTGSQQRELLTVIDEECDRLNQLVGDAAEMARLDAGEFELQLEPNSVHEIVAAALQHCKSVLGNRPVRVEIAPDLPPVRADFARVKDVLVRLDRECQCLYSPRDQPITISAEVTGDFVATALPTADRASRRWSWA